MREQDPPRLSGGVSFRWMITFADLISLLLTFFVMLFAMSSLKVESWEATSDSLARRLHPTRGLERLEPRDTDVVPTVAETPAVDLDYLKAVVRAKIRDDPILAQAVLERRDDRLVITLHADLLFGSGEATLTEEAHQTVARLGDALRFVGNRVEVNGHADPRPVKGGSFASNWELSIARALAVARALEGAGYSRRIIAYGMAASRYADLEAALPEGERERLARRVDVVVREPAASGGSGGF